MQPNLSDQQKTYLQVLRADPQFRELMEVFRPPPLRPWRKAKPITHEVFVHESGRFEAMNEFVSFLVYGNDRKAELG